MFLLISLLANGTNGGDHRTHTVSRFGSTNGALSAYSGINGAINWSMYGQCMPKLSLVKRLYIKKTFLHFNPDNPDQKRESTYMMMSLHTGSIMHLIFCFLSIEFIGILFKVLVSLKLKYTHLPDIFVDTS